MNFKQFKQDFPQPYFSTDELKLYFAGDYKYHLRYWREKGKVTKLMKGWYLFADTTFTQDLRFELANKIYSPSYISLESSLAYHGVIPESVRVTTSITTRRTREIETSQGVFLYQSVKPKLFHSSKVIQTGDRSFTIAPLDKTVLDYLYLHPEIDSVNDFEELRWNRDLLRESYIVNQLPELADNYTNKATRKRVDLLLTYLHA